MRKTVKDWVQNCIACQRSKVHRHTKTPLGTFALPDARFSHIHVDLIGPLPSSEGKSFCLTIVDRFTRWPEASAKERLNGLHENIKWTETLPAVLLGLRVAVKPDINASSAELVYGVSQITSRDMH
ncbi:transposon Ty3-I Gag-Pol polyprotein [Trichonephila clavipes]|nr:transposon Ty3-I Gag-Pol polyprotein [Trichonephila clavipes]